MKYASFLILFCIFICFLPIAWLKIPEKDIEITGRIKVYNHLTDEIFEMSLEEYTARCMASEMPVSFHKEALKAQAVAIRSYTLSKNPSEEHKGAEVCTDFNHCAAYLQEGEPSYVYLEAAKETENQILMFEGEIANTVFHAMSCGKTENSEDVWGGAVPYLKSVDCKCDTTLENFKSYAFFTHGQAAELLGVPKMSEWEITKTDAGGVKTVKISDKVFTGAEIRKIFSLKSSAFDVKMTDEGVEFTVYGYGHGVGMSQYGADAFARDGMSYKEILSHFYKGTELISIDFGA